MTDDTTGDKPKNPKKNSNVKPLHKGIKVDDGEQVEQPIIVDKELAVSAAAILDGILKGEIVGLVYVTARSDQLDNYDMVGVFPNVDRTQNIIRVLEDDYYELMTRPNIVGDEVFEYE